MEVASRNDTNVIGSVASVNKTADERRSVGTSSYGKAEISLINASAEVIRKVKIYSWGLNRNLVNTSKVTKLVNVLAIDGKAIIG